MNKRVERNFLLITITGAVLITANSARASISISKKEIFPSNTLIAVEFTPPNDSLPDSSIGDGIRGQVQFSLPRRSTGPRTSVGGGTRGEVQFSLPRGSTGPRTSVGGGTRGEVQFSLPRGSTGPRTSVGGGTRGENIPLTALVPPNKYGRTVSPHPTIYAYLPPIGAEEVFFSLQDEEGNSYYYTMLRVPPEGGVISVTLPSKLPALEINKNYLWYFAPIEPGGILRPDNYAVIGWVKRVEVNINAPQLAAPPVQLATEYAKAGIWYDTLKVLADAQRADPNDRTFATEWHDLLKQVGLEGIASQPLTEALPSENGFN